MIFNRSAQQFSSYSSKTSATFSGMSDQHRECFMRTQLCSRPVAMLDVPPVGPVPVCTDCLRKAPPGAAWSYIPGRRPS